jgi:LysR family glycine cleavage system transcriptional activator
MDHLSLNSIKVFVLAAQCLSFKTAAAQLHVTPGAVSRQIKVLEERLGVVLFTRQYKEVSLTQAGFNYFKLVQPAIAQLESANQLFLKQARQSVLKIETSPTFALHWLIPRLANFKQQHPQVQIEISTSSYAINPRSEFDLYIRRDPEQFAGLKHQPFMTEYCHIVCAKKLLSGAQDMQQLLHTAPAISYKTRSDLWQQWFIAKQYDNQKQVSDISFENTIFAIQAVVEGLGIVPQVFLADLLHSGALVVPFNESPIASGEYSVLALDTHYSDAQKCFIEWLIDQGAQ